jgi:16S rRNA (uracil1498-N3)-methyltransferase
LPQQLRPIHRYCKRAGMNPDRVARPDRTAGKVRLFVDRPLAGDMAIEIDPAKAHYLIKVMRLRPGDPVMLFNGRDGEWRAALGPAGKRGCSLTVEARLRPQAAEQGPALLFAPLKRTRQELLLEKATELGVARLLPVGTRRAVVDKINPARLEAIVIEAAEQSERLTLPVLEPLLPLDEALSRWPADQPLYAGDETGGGRPLLEAFAAHGPGGILIGPEGGFDPAEHESLRTSAGVIPVDLGPRILRAETAAFAALACWQAVFGATSGPGPEA